MYRGLSTDRSAEVEWRRADGDDGGVLCSVHPHNTHCFVVNPGKRREVMVPKVCGGDSGCQWW